MPSQSSSPRLPVELTGPADRRDYLWEVLRVLWPEPARITRYGRTAPGRADRTEFLVVPSMQRAKLLLPRRPRRAAAAALRHYKASAAAPRRLAFHGLALAAQAGLGDILPHRISIEAGQEAADADISGYLAGVLHQEVIISLRIGPPRANRKPVLELLTADGKLLGFAKVGVNALTRELVRAEAAALAALGAARLVRLVTPRLIHHGQWQGHEVLVQGALSGTTPPRNWTGMSQAMAELAAVQGVTRLPADQSPYWRDLRHRLASCTQRDLVDAMLQALGHLQPAAATTIIAFGSWHGDWTPWNMTVSGGRALVWDWERFADGVPVGYDAVHYRLQALVSSGWAPRAAAEATVAEAPAVLAPFGIQPGPARFIAALYLLEIAARYLHDGQAEAGARLGDVGNWVLPALMRQSHEAGVSGRPSGLK
jgi:phosphotransferase family enzyme